MSGSEHLAAAELAQVAVGVAVAFDAAAEEWARSTSNARGTSLDWRTAVFAAGRVGPKAPPARTRTPAARSDLPPGPGGDARLRPHLWGPLVDQSDGWVSA